MIQLVFSRTTLSAILSIDSRGKERARRLIKDCIIKFKQETIVFCVMVIAMEMLK